MSRPFFENPILNSPYTVPTRRHALDKDGQPLDQPPLDGRRRSEGITPVPRPRRQKKKAGGEQGKFVFSDLEGLSTPEQEYNPTPIINEIREHLAAWRAIPNPADWGVTPATARLLQHLPDLTVSRDPGHVEQALAIRALGALDGRETRGFT